MNGDRFICGDDGWVHVVPATGIATLCGRPSVGDPLTTPLDVADVHGDCVEIDDRRVDASRRRR